MKEKYNITTVVEKDDEYSNTQQIKDLVSDIQMKISDYNCFNIVENVKAEKYKPDMREKIKEYIGELDSEIKRLEEDMVKREPYVTQNYMVRIQTLQEVRNDLLGRLEEVV